MNSWILIIAMFGPSGDFIDKRSVSFDSKKACEVVRKQLHNLDHPLGVKHNGLCVTKDHWEGRKQMSGVAYD
jgi:hypothetical protein